MSKYTGKCDFADECEMIYNPQEIVKNARIYLGDAKVEIKSEKDLFPYYTHLIASMASLKENGMTIHLSQDSFINTEERERISWRVRDAIYFARQAKKEKKDFNYDYVINHKNFSELGTIDKSLWNAIIDRIIKNPEIAKVHLSKDFREMNHFLKQWVVPEYFNGIHTALGNSQRLHFLEDCEKFGYQTYKIVGSEMKVVEGEYHPVIWDMCNDVYLYEKQVEKFGN